MAGPTGPGAPASRSAAAAGAQPGDLAPLLAGASQLGLALDAQQQERFARLRDLLLEWNARINLTAITDPAGVVTRHFLDSLALLDALPPSAREGGTVLLDVGSGAGFPGLPLAIAFPGWRVTLLEATGKKVRFIDTAIAALGLLNAHAVAARAEEYAKVPGQRGRYDAVTARAVAPLPTLLEYCCPFVHPGGRVLAPKKGDLSDELAAGEKAASQLGARLLLPPVPVSVPPLDDGRVIVVARQEQPCPPRYPRPQGAPAKRPLGGQP